MIRLAKAVSGDRAIRIVEGCVKGAQAGQGTPVIGDLGIRSVVAMVLGLVSLLLGSAWVEGPGFVATYGDVGSEDPKEARERGINTLGSR